MVQRCRDIIDYVRPLAWFIENAQSGRLRGRQVVADLPFVVVDYCMYGWPYRKRTIIFTNATGQRWTRAQKAGKHRGDGFTCQELYAMPPQLCHEIYSAACGIMRLSRLA